jgi:alkaline phosphatase D
MTHLSKSLHPEKRPGAWFWRFVFRAALIGVVAHMPSVQAAPKHAKAMATAARLVSGPMAGPSEHRAITLWVQTDRRAIARIEYWPLANPQQRIRSAALAANTSAQFTIHFRLTELQPGTRYGYRLLLDDQVASEDLAFATQVLWQWRTDAPDFTVLAGSCNFGNEPLVDRPGKPYGDRHEIFDVMANQSPDLTLWLGDNLYYREVDYSSREGMEHRWAYERKQPYVQKLLRTGSHAAIWDDHDYGPNDSNASFVLKADALDLQKRYWANPGYGLPEVPGAFTTFSFGDADFFMLDNRWYRDDPKLNDTQRAMFGVRQMRWLKNALLSSTARFKLIAGGSQFLHKSLRGETWVDYPEEREDFLRFLAETRVSGVMFLSGDVHRTELTKVERPGSYPLHDLTCSPMTSGVYMDERLKVRENLVPGTVVLGERNFCHLRFEGNRAERRLILRSVATDGKTQWTHQITAAELGAEQKASVSTTK